MSKSIFSDAVKIGELKSGIVVGNFKYSWTDDPATASFNDTLFFSEHTSSVIGQRDAKGIVLLKAKVKKESTNVTTPSTPEVWESYFQYGINERGVVMNSDNDLVAAPCPPYCSAGSK